ncbi:SH3 domain-containing protein, partial [Mesorhizobium sp. M2A.F.Ca.ET.037.01.1.1]
MNEPFSFGTPERQRFTMQFGYNVRPSFWQKVQSNAHLVIAAVGTVALLGVAGVALWLCIPGSGRQVAAASAEQRDRAH